MFLVIMTTTIAKIALTRPEHDLLITHYPDWMARVWTTLDRKWCLGGVIVKGSEIFIAEIRNKLESVGVVKV